MKQVDFKGWKCNVQFSEYSNGRTAILLNDSSEPLETVAVATINLPDVPLLEDEVIIKDYSENEGIYEVLVEAGIISQGYKQVRTGFVSAPVCKLLQS